MKSWYTRSSQPGPLLLSGRRALERYQLLPSKPLFAEEEFSCLWRECGFCSPDNSADLIRHVYFHCYHTKLKQWGLQALQSQADLSPCILDFQSRNLIPDIPDHFLCLWAHCEVSRQSQE